MPLYIRDYLGDTMHLTTQEHGAYMLIIMAMWLAGGSLTTDPSQLARIARMSPKEWAQISPTIMRFFKFRHDEMTHSRISAELAKSQKIISVRSTAGKRGAEKRWASAGGVVVPLERERE